MRPVRRERAASALLLSVWLALIGADRINLLGGVASFVATPYLALTPLVLLVEVARRRREGRPIVIPRSLTVYAGLLAFVIALATASVVGSPALGKSAQRVLLLGLHIVGTLAVAVAAGDRADLQRVLARGAALGIVLFAVFDVLNLASLFSLVPVDVQWGPLSISFKTYLYTSLLPRLAGPVVDVNRGGFVLATFSFLLWRGYPRGRLRGALLVLAAVMLLITVSRSAILAAAAMVLVLVATSRRFQVRRTQLAAATLVLFLAAVTMVVIPDRLAHAAALLAPLMQRFSPQEGSAAQHVDLLERGVATGTQSVRRVALGIGYGSSFTILQDLFPNNKYASFHSLFVTIFAECGVVALVAMVALIGVPILLSGAYRSVVLGTALFNVAQNAMTEPLFWLVLALAWFSLPSAAVHREMLPQTPHRE